jgi:hypothetical protein
MKVYGNVTLSEGSDIRNLTVPHGDTYPDNPSNGELFYLNTVGICVYDNGSWQKLAVDSQQICNDSFTIETVNGLVTKIIPSVPFKSGSTQLYVAGLRLKLNADYAEHYGHISLNFDLSQEEINAGANIVLDFRTAF